MTEYLIANLTPKEHKRLFAKIKIDKKSGCWLWAGGKDQSGYGQGFLQGRRERVHRIIYAAYKGPIERNKGKKIKQLDHLCRVKHCCNPDHLELVTPRENVHRGTSPVAINVKKKVCKYGHKFSVAPSGRRVCRTCDNARHKRRKEGANKEYWKQKAREAAKRWYEKHKKVTTS